jgi:hypothetical protein
MVGIYNVRQFVTLREGSVPLERNFHNFYTLYLDKNRLRALREVFLRFITSAVKERDTVYSYFLALLTMYRISGVDILS